MWTSSNGKNVALMDKTIDHILLMRKRDRTSRILSVFQEKENSNTPTCPQEEEASNQEICWLWIAMKNSEPQEPSISWIILMTTRRRSKQSSLGCLDLFGLRSHLANQRLEPFLRLFYLGLQHSDRKTMKNYHSLCNFDRFSIVCIAN